MTGVRRTPDQTLTEAQRLLDAGLVFQAHEVLEDAWKAAGSGERDLWRGLAQLAVGLTHAARGNPRGAITVLSRGAAALDEHPDPGAYGLDVPALVAWTDRAVADVRSGRAIGAPLRLRPGR